MFCDDCGKMLDFVAAFCPQNIQKVYFMLFSPRKLLELAQLQAQDSSFNLQ